MSSSDEAPEEKSFKKGKEKHLEIEDLKIKKKRKKLNKNLLQSMVMYVLIFLIFRNEAIAKQKKEVIEIKKENKVIVNTEFEEKDKKTVSGLEIQVLKKDSKPFVDREITDWLKYHFYGPRLKRQSTNEWLSNKREKAGTRIIFVENKI